jgi:hypothetical protein
MRRLDNQIWSLYHLAISFLLRLKGENMLKEQEGIHQRNTRKGKVAFIYGNGCSDWRNCFTCPKEDCTWSETTESERRLSYQATVNELIKELKQIKRN